VKFFEEKGFVFNKWQPIFPWILFVGEKIVLVIQLVGAMAWPKTQNGKDVQHT